MGEIKSVKVDNWGVFFLQKLQNFFNKTDYCDLTLQFRDNSQLKVHRLVLSACTDYFNVLERESDSQDDILYMPRDLQADVVVPIVNFMYTGTLEFEYEMYDRLFKTAREMNMTVLVKLLDAHRKKTAILPQKTGTILNKNYINRGSHIPQAGRPPNATKIAQYQPLASNQYTTQSKTTYERGPQQSTISKRGGGRGYAAKHISNIVKSSHVAQFLPKTDIPETIAIVSKYRAADNSKGGPSRYEPPSDDIPDNFDEFNNISYESKPLMKPDDGNEYEEEYSPSTSSSTFEQLRRGYTNKRLATSSSASPPNKKLNLQDVKEYTEAARLRKQLEAEGAEDETAYVYEDDTHFNDDDDEDNNVQQNKPTSIKTETKLYTKEEDSRIVVKDNSGNVHHAQIISEVLKKYPHLVKNNKNIKLKIMQKASQNQPTTVQTIKQEKQSPTKPLITQIKAEKPEITISAIKAQEGKIIKTQATPVVAQQPASTGPKKIDSKTMHALIAKGAENMTGPWLCLKCGIGGRPISIPSYKGFRRHLINIHKEKIDPRICEHCGWKALKKNELIQHYLNAHNIKIKVESISATSEHAQKTKPEKKEIVQHCIYCNKVFSKESLLYTHMKAMHKQKAREDGVVDFSDDEQQFDDSDKYIPNDPTASTSAEKIKILSNISLPTKGGIPFVLDPGAQPVSQIGGKSSNVQQQIVNLEPSSEAEALSNVASGIATSLGLVDSAVVLDDGQYHSDHSLLQSQYIEGDLEGGKDSDQSLMTKLVTSDGTELQLTPSQKEEILSQLQEQGGNLSDNVVMVLNQDNYETSSIMGADGQNIMVVYSQTDPNNPLKESTNAEEGNEHVDDHNAPSDAHWSDENILEKENSDKKTPVIEEKEESNTSLKKDDDEQIEETNEDEEKKDQETKNDKEKLEKMKLISALEGDWTDDEEEEPQSSNTTTDVKTSISESKSPEIENTDKDSTKESSGEIGPTNTDVDDNKDESLEKEMLFLTSDKTEENVKPNKTINENEDKELKSVLNDWYDETSDGEKKTDTKEVKPEETLKTDQTNETEEPEEGKETKKNEIKTLINDWDDEEDDL